MYEFKTRWKPCDLDLNVMLDVCLHFSSHSWPASGEHNYADCHANVQRAEKVDLRSLVQKYGCQTSTWSKVSRTLPIGGARCA